MIDFILTDEQKQLRDLVRKFAQREIAPVAAELDREQRFSQEIVDKYFQTGLLHSHVPEKYGGAELSSLDGCIVAEEIAAACGGVASYLGANNLGLTPFLIAGSPELKEELLPQHCESPNLAAFCLTEAGAGSDVASMRSTASS